MFSLLLAFNNSFKLARPSLVRNAPFRKGSLWARLGFPDMGTLKMLHLVQSIG